MTAEIGILNKTSVVLATDSAVTISRVNKVFNNANKLFPLSKYQPVGIMIFNNASWMGIPLEIIIKSYTKKLCDKSLNTLIEYRNDFIEFIKENYSTFVDTKQIQDFIEMRLYELLEKLMDYCKNALDEACKSSPKQLSEKEKTELNEKIFFKIIDEYASYKTEVLPDFKTYTQEDFKKDFKKYINKILPYFYSNYKLTRKSLYTNRIYKQLYHELICSFSDDEDFSGIVIAGYGEKEIFPSICDIKIGELISNRLRYEYSEIGQVSQNKTAIVRPYAQRDMVDTFFQGINPNLMSKINEIIPAKFEEIMDKITNKYPNINKQDIFSFFKTGFKHINEELDKFASKEYIRPVVQSIGYLRKEDLIELAESLINITSVKRKTSDYLQTVGGPVDIAIITKYEGFVWIKRKEIIDKQLNSMFYNREFKDI